MNRLITCTIMAFSYIAGQTGGRHWYSVLYFIAGMLLGRLIFVGIKMTRGGIR